MTVQETISAPAAPERYRLRQEDYLLLDRSGAFRSYARTELIEGVIVAVNAQFSRHARVQKQLYRALSDACAVAEPGLEAWFEISVALAPESMPLPDLIVARSLPENGPAPVEAIVLVAEVADSTLQHDLEKKVHLYAGAGIPEYWVADVTGKVIHQMWAPAGGDYTERCAVPFGEPITAVTVPGLAVETRGL